MVKLAVMITCAFSKVHNWLEDFLTKQFVEALMAPRLVVIFFECACGKRSGWFYGHLARRGFSYLYWVASSKMHKQSVRGGISGTVKRAWKVRRPGYDSLLKNTHHGGDTTSCDGLWAASTQRATFCMIMSLTVRLKIYQHEERSRLGRYGRALPFLRDRRTTHRRMAVDNPEIIGKRTGTK